MESIASRTFFGNNVLSYALSVVTIVVGIAAVSIAQSILKKRAVSSKEKSGAPFIAGIAVFGQRAIFPLLYLLVAYASVMRLAMPQFVEKILKTGFTAAFTIVATNILITVANSVIQRTLLAKGESDTRRLTFTTIWPFAQAFIWGVSVIFLLENIGFKITTLVAGLGVGGVAVALAGQALLKDVFGYFTILLDKPFELGDFITAGESMGTVEHIGLKTTRVRSLGGELLIFANTDLTNSRIRNFKHMTRRRIEFRIEVAYETRRELLETVPSIIEASIKSASQTVFDRAHVASFGDLGIIFEAVYFVESADFNLYMDIQQEINIGIMRSFEKEGISFAQSVPLPAARQQ